MNLKLYKQFCGAYQQCVQAALEDSHIQGDVKIVAKGLPTEGITMLFEKKERYLSCHFHEGSISENGDAKHVGRGIGGPGN